MMGPSYFRVRFDMPVEAHVGSVCESGENTDNPVMDGCSDICCDRGDKWLRRTEKFLKALFLKIKVLQMCVHFFFFLLDNICTGGKRMHYHRNVLI